MELALGGELYATYEKKDFYGSQRHAQFYCAGMVLALSHLHTHNIIYRDLKPENVLLNETGHVKLCDFGLAKISIGMTYTCCGTPDYFAPEVINGDGYHFGVDWWTLGVLMYELMAGNPPFEGNSNSETYKLIQQGIDQVIFPESCKGEVGKLVKSILKKSPSERLPMRKGGVNNIKLHKWYTGFRWEAFEALKMPPPHVPNVKSSTDSRNFVVDPDSLPEKMEYKDPGTGWDKPFATSNVV